MVLQMLYSDERKKPKMRIEASVKDKGSKSDG